MREHGTGNQAVREFPRLSVAIQHRLSRRDDGFSLDVSFDIHDWPAVLFGPSGAGKSSVLRVIAGLDRADQAVITFDDQSLLSRATPGTVQMVTQRAALFPHLSVEQNVAFGLSSLRSLERKARAQEMLALLGAESLAQRRVSTLSGGERQRIAIARALAPGPRLLLLDEAFAGLDATAKQEILGRLMPLLEERGIASLHVTHEVGEAFALNAEVVVLGQGRVLSQGQAQQVLARERNQLLATLMQTANPRHDSPGFRKP